MRILVLQLARFGDIYQTWPVLKALKRTHPDAEVHVLVRHRFRHATEGLNGVITHSWPTADILKPIFEDGDEDAAHSLLQSAIAPLKQLEFHRIVNLTFSPVSSYLTDILSHPQTHVAGYTRFEDGYLSIPDDGSAYFFAQGQIGKFNRYHITQIFALVAQVVLEESDFVGVPAPARREGVIVHLGASQAIRQYPPERWAEVIREGLTFTNENWILVGSPEERGLSEAVRELVADPRLSNQTGETTLPELMKRIAGAKLFVGCDSAPAQMASLARTPVLQLTSNTANFWTTGPTSPGSRVIHHEHLADIEPRRIAVEIRAMLEGRPPAGPCATRANAIDQYELHDLAFNDFGWKMIEAIYTQTDYPEAETEADLLAFQRLFELSELALQQLEVFDQPEKRKTAALFLSNIDQMLIEIPKLNPRVDPLIQWFETERLRIPPGQAEQTLAVTKKLFGELNLISSIYRRYEGPALEGQRAIDLARRCLPAIREFRMASVQDDFQSLLSALHEPSRHSTKVGDQAWSRMLGGLNEALDRRDLIEVADQLEYVLIPALS